MEEETSDKQQEVENRGDPKVKPEHSKSIKRAEKTSQENREK